jgi:hypothetical protein
MQNKSEQQQDKEKKAEEYFNQMKADYEAVFNSEPGKRVLEDLKWACFYQRTTFATDALTIAVNEGRRIVCLHLIHMATPRPAETVEKETAIK